MLTNTIKNILLQYLSVEKVYVITNGQHYQIIVIDHKLNSKTKLEQHKIVYTPLMKYIVNNIIHSISIHVFDPNEWHKQRHLYKI